MSEYCLMTDSCCDLSAELADELGVRVLPLSFVMEEREYFNYPDGRDIRPEVFYEKLRAGSMGTTSAVSVGAFREAMAKEAAAGRDVLRICFSSALSATCQSACIAAGEVMDAFPGRTVAVVDSLCASLGQGMLVYLAARERAKGRTLEQVRAYAEETKGAVAHWFTVDDLHHLKRGGRVSAATALVGTMLQIKPVLHVDDAGRLINVDKTRGRKAAIRALLQRMEETALSETPVFISHGDCAGEAEELAAAIRERFLGVEPVINFVGPVIGSHSGPGTVALFFLAKRR